MRIFLATCENFRHYQCASVAGIKNVLFSYYHLELKSKNTPTLFRLMNERKQKVICDSGLFTMMFGAGKGNTYTYDDLVKYTKGYIANAQKFGVEDLTIVEMDTHKILPLQNLFEFRKHFEDSGMKVLYVWHNEEGIDGLYRMAEKYEYIALSVPELRVLCTGKKVRYQDVVNDLLYKIKRNTTRMPKVHLLGNTVMETMENGLGYSCDSSSWTYGIRHSRTTFYQDGKLMQRYLGRETSAEWHQKFQAAVDEILESNPEAKAMLEGQTANYRIYMSNLIFSALSHKMYQNSLNLKFPYEERV